VKVGGFGSGAIGRSAYEDGEDGDEEDAYDEGGGYGYRYAGSADDDDDDEEEDTVGVIPALGIDISVAQRLAGCVFKTCTPSCWISPTSSASSARLYEHSYSI
jgi:hypothetical protein